MPVKHTQRERRNNKRNEIYAFDLTGNETLAELITKLKNGAYADRILNQVVGDGAAVLGDSVDKIELDKMLAAEGVTTGTSTAYILTQPNFFLIDGATIRLYLHITPGLAATLNVNNTGAKALDIPQGFPIGWYALTYHSATGKYVPVGVGTQYRQNFNIAAGTPYQTPPPLFVARYGLAAATDGNGRVLFGGGMGSGGIASNVVDCYEKSGTRITLPSLSAGRYWLAAATDGNGRVLFGGGIASNVVDCYEKSGTRITLPPLSVARGELAAATDGNGRVLFGGGGNSNVVDSYGVSTWIDIIVLPYSRYKFLEHATEQTALTTSIMVPRPNQGYVRYGGDTIQIT